MSNSKEIITFNPVKILHSLTEAQSMASDQQIFWWFTNITSFIHSFKHQPSFDTWAQQGYPLWELSQTSRECLHSHLSDCQRCLIISQEMLSQSNPNWDKEVELLIKNAFGTNEELANNPLLINTLKLIKTNFYNGFYERYEQDFDSFLETKTLNKTVVDFWIYTLRANFNISAMENEVWLMLGGIKNDDILSSLWVDYKAHNDIYSHFGFILDKENNKPQTLNQLLEETKSKYKQELLSNHTWGTDMMYIANPNCEWELKPNQLQERKSLYIRLLSDYLGKLDNTINFVIKFK